MGKHILVVGSINVDYVIHTERLPQLGETLTGSNFSMNFGGKGANQAIALAKSGCTVQMLGAVGSDGAGEAAIANLRAFGVNCDDVLRADTSTGAAVITVCGGDNHILLDAGANACVTPRLIEEKRSLFEWADILVLQYEIPAESVMAAARLGHTLGKTVVVNPAPVRQMPDEFFTYVDLLVPNEFEAELLTGILPQDRKSAQQALEAILHMGCRGAIVTMGKRGSAYLTEDRTVSFAGIYPIHAVDSTAAGDSFIGGVCTKLCEGATMTEAVCYAAGVSALTVSRPGAGGSIPTEAEVTAFLKSAQMKEFEG